MNDHDETKKVNVVSEPYCDGCPKWNPTKVTFAATTFDGEEIVIAEADYLQCINRDLCKDRDLYNELYKQIEKYLKENENGNQRT